MNSRIFTELYNDSTFCKNVTAMLRKMYAQSLRFFQDKAIDFDDFVQEMWCELLEEDRFISDRAWCMNVIKCNAHDYIKAMRAGVGIYEFVEYTDETDARLDD
jgi:hypothetical protein